MEYVTKQSTDRNKPVVSSNALYDMFPLLAKLNPRGLMSSEEIISRALYLWLRYWEARDNEFRVVIQKRTRKGWRKVEEIGVA